MHIREDDVLVLTTCTSDGISNEGFKYPLVEGALFDLSHWNNEPVRSGGLYGLPWGVGSIMRLSNDPEAIWLLLKVKKSFCYIHGIGDFEEECKFRTGIINYIGNRYDAISILQELAPRRTPVMFSMQREENNADQIAGNHSIQYAGNFSVQNTGELSIQSAADCSIQTATDCSIQTAGHHVSQTAESWAIQNSNRCSTQYAGHTSVQISEDESMQRAGTNSHQIALDKTIQIAEGYSVQVSGDNSHQTAGYFAVQITKNNSKQIAKEGTVQISHWFDSSGKQQVSTRIVTKDMDEKPYYVKDGVWKEIKKPNV